jgi:lipopolysaccharide/colanic/teichoic acid biosynthesis glycosyltransferase
MPRSRPLFQLIDFALICLAFAVAIAVYEPLFPEKFLSLMRNGVLARFAVSVVTFWAATWIYEGSRSQSIWSLTLDQFCLGTGANLIVQAILHYFLLLSRSFYLILAGGLLATILLAFARIWIYSRAGTVQDCILFVGFGPIAQAIASASSVPVAGVVGTPSPELVSSDLPMLGAISQIDRVVSEQRPTQIIVSKGPEADILPAVLLRYRVRGIAVTDASSFYEKLFSRVYCQDVDPADLLLSPALRPHHRTMAIQSIYTNLIGTFFLVLSAPLLILASISLALFSRPGPLFESVDCVGFRNIPFSLLRFRTRRMDGTGRLTPVGSILARLHLTNLPQIINLTRGEMSLFGPRPVRREFARFMTALIPFYGLRFCIKPGMFGWAQMHLRRQAPNEFAQLGYDLHYIKEGSPLLDLLILVGTLFPLL